MVENDKQWSLKFDKIWYFIRVSVTSIQLRVYGGWKMQRSEKVRTCIRRTESHLISDRLCQRRSNSSSKGCTGKVSVVVEIDFSAINIFVNSKIIHILPPSKLLSLFRNFKMYTHWTFEKKMNFKMSSKKFTFSNCSPGTFG